MTTIEQRPAATLRTPEGLRAWRAQHGLSQAQLGKLLEVTNVSVSRWELGLVPIPRMADLALRYLELSYAVRAP